jgi:hypothetical protein
MKLWGLLTLHGGAGAGQVCVSSTSKYWRGRTSWWKNLSQEGKEMGCGQKEAWSGGNVLLWLPLLSSRSQAAATSVSLLAWFNMFLGEETSQISGAPQGSGMLASEEFEHQKVQRWLENSILKLSEAKHVLSILFL